MVREIEWKIESRQRPLQENPVGELAGHNYLVLVSPTGQVVEELHGWKKEGLLKTIRVRNDVANVGVQPAESDAAKKTAVKTTKTSHAVSGDANTSRVVRAGTFGRVRKFWDAALVEAGKLDRKNIRYDIFS